MKKFATLLVFLVAGCDKKIVKPLPDEVVTDCFEDSQTEVPAAEVPFDFAAVAARSDTRVAPGNWANNDATDVTITTVVQTDVAVHLQPLDLACANPERWLVHVDVTMTTSDNTIDTTWTQLVTADATDIWDLGVSFQGAEAASIRAAAGYPAVADPSATLTALWGSDLDGTLLTPTTNPDSDETVLALDFATP